MTTGDGGVDGGPRLIAHRGFAGVFPENTVAAVRGAAEQGATMVEVDCRECATGEVVVHHDETVERVTEERGRVRDYSASALRDMDVLGSGYGIPTLATVIDELPAGVGLNVELKEPGIASAVFDQVTNLDAEVIVSSFDTAILADAGATPHERPLALLVDSRPRTAVRRATAANCRYVHPRARLCLRSLLVRRAHRAGLDVNAWTLHSRRMTRLLTRIGVDGLIADTPDVL